MKKKNKEYELVHRDGCRYDYAPAGDSPCDCFITITTEEYEELQSRITELKLQLYNTKQQMWGMMRSSLRNDAKEILMSSKKGVS